MTLAKRGRNIEFILSVYSAFSLAVSIFVLPPCLVSHYFELNFGSGLLSQFYCLIVALFSIIGGLRLGHYCVNQNEIESNRLAKFLKTEEGQELVSRGYKTIPFKWIDYEYQTAERYIEIGSGENIRRFDFDPFDNEFWPVAVQ